LKPTAAADPTWGILSVLGLTIGMPYFLLSTTGPLLQAWYAREHKGAHAVPALCALQCRVDVRAAQLPGIVRAQVDHTPAGRHVVHRVWSVCAVVRVHGFPGAQFRAAGSGAVGESIAKRPAPRQYVMWLLLPFTASVLLLAITNHISQNVAAIPFLWILPLSLYLLSFILCFESSGWYRRNPYLQLVAVALGGMAYGIAIDSAGNMPIWWMLVLFGLGLFTCCMVCHGELARLKPDPKYLTHFYLTISAGGALGGIFVGLVAPHIFQSFYEMPLGLVLARC
jgi:hypothetical protein